MTTGIKVSVMSEERQPFWLERWIRLAAAPASQTVCLSNWVEKCRDYYRYYREFCS